MYNAYCAALLCRQDTGVKIVCVIDGLLWCVVYANTSICQISVYEFVRSALKGHALTVCEACKLRAIETVIDLLVQVLLQRYVYVYNHNI